MDLSASSSSSATSTSVSSTSITKPTKSAPFSVMKEPKTRPRMMSKKRSRKVVDLGESIRSNTSLNMWVKEKNDNENDKTRRAQFLRTASKLGRRLIDMDQETEARKVKKKNKPEEKPKFRF